MPELQSATWPPRGGRRREAPAGNNRRVDLERGSRAHAALLTCWQGPDPQPWVKEYTRIGNVRLAGPTTARAVCHIQKICSPKYGLAEPPHIESQNLSASAVCGRLEHTPGTKRWPDGGKQCPAGTYRCYFWVNWPCRSCSRPLGHLEVADAARRPLVKSRASGF